MVSPFSAYSAEQVAKIDSLVSQWLSLEKQNTQLQQDWQQQQPQLVQRLSLLEAQKKQLEALLNEKSSSSSEVEKKRLALIDEQSQLEIEQQELQSGVDLLNKQLAGLHDQIAPPVQTSWLVESAKVNDDSDKAIKLQMSLAKLQSLTEFDQRISVIQSAILTPQDEKIVVKQLYLGTGIAWFVSADQHYVGIGQPSIDGWQWHFNDEMDGREVARAIAIFEKQTEANFVSLPYANGAQ